MLRYAFIIFALGGSLSVGVCAAESPLDPRSGDFFETHIRPVLATKCLKCHGAKKQESNLRLDSRAAMLKGGDSGPAVVPGKPGESYLIEALKYESFEMPPTGQLPESDIKNFELWVAANANWPEHAATIREVSGEITASDRNWWAFRPLDKPEVPQTAGDNWSQNDIDRFVLHKLAEKQMRPAPRAEKERLIRRVYFDLLGVPPSSDEVDRFLADDSPDAWEHLIDRLLADERYGEHWARYWLDVVRYAESDGWNKDSFRPQMYLYRDYVVKSFNSDKPYPQFVREQLAGDEIPGDNPDALVATGYLRLGIYEYNQRDAKGHWNDIMNEMTDVTGDVFLGMSMQCCRCHDHKFDPLPQADYYRLRAFFEPIIWRDDQVYATEEQKRQHQEASREWLEKTAEIRAQMDELTGPAFKKKWESTVEKFPLDIQACYHKPESERNSWEQQMTYLIGRQFYDESGGPFAKMSKENKAKYDELAKELKKFDDIKPPALPELMTVSDFAGPISPTTIPDDPDQRSIEPGFLTVLMPVSTTVKPDMPELKTSSGRRTALAEWIGNDDNPLTTRVIVNRIWQQHFGQGIVTSASDFGHLGQPPTHPDLLDWLTVTFVEDGWSFKKLHKRILMSATWQQSSQHPDADKYQEIDPAENLMWRSRVRRLTAEQIRDAMFVASGELKQQIGGPSVSGSTPRRSLYVKAIRNTPDTFLQLFDVANGLKSTAERNITTTPVQSLLMINGELTVGRAKKMSERLVKAKFSTPSELVDRAFRLTWLRLPTAEERAAANQFLGVTAETETTQIDADKLTDLCHVLMNSNEFLYVD